MPTGARTARHAAGRDVNDDDLASQPTLCRFENSVGFRGLLKVATRVESGKTFTRLHLPMDFCDKSIFQAAVPTAG